MPNTKIPITEFFEWSTKDGCMHCTLIRCLKACPSPGAIVQYSNGIVDFIHENCIGCGYCITGEVLRHSAHQPDQACQL